MKLLLLFIFRNKATLTSVVIGLIVAYFYWPNYATYWGTYPFSSECWANCIYGILIGGFLGSFLFRKSSF